PEVDVESSQRLEGRASVHHVRSPDLRILPRGDGHHGRPVMFHDGQVVEQSRTLEKPRWRLGLPPGPDTPPRAVNAPFVQHAGGRRDPVDRRSEEHTSELQSRFDLVCRLLLEKKKTMHRYMSWSWTSA